MKTILGVFAMFGANKSHLKNQNIGFYELEYRPQHGTGLSFFELQKLKQKNGWYYVPDVRLDGNNYVVRIRGEIFKTQSTQTMMEYLKARSGSFLTC